MASSSSPLNTARTISASSVPSQSSNINTPIKEDTPSYKTYPFVLGTSGIALGAVGALIKTKLEPDVYSKTEANGETKRLEVHYSKQGNKPLADACYDHYDSNNNATQKSFLPDSAVFLAQDNGYMANIPYYTTNAKGLKELAYEQAFWDTEAKTLRRKGDLKGLQSPLSSWYEAPLHTSDKSQGLEDMTHGVKLQLNKPIQLEGTTSPVMKSLVFFHSGQGSETAQLLVKDGTLLRVDLNEQGCIHNATIQGLNGLPVLFKEQLPDTENIMKDVPAYVNKLKTGLIKEEKAYGKNIFLGILVTGAVGYGLGWFLDWKKRHDRKKVEQPKEVEKPSTTLNHTV
jgi:hypothetical protein